MTLGHATATVSLCAALCGRRLVEKGTDELRSESRYDGKKERAREDGVVALEEV